MNFDRLHAYRFQLPLVAPLAMARGTLTHREGLLIESEGGWAEASPLPGWSRESLAEAEADLIQVVRSGNVSTAKTASIQFALACLNPEKFCHSMAEQKEALPLNGKILAGESEHETVCPINVLLAGSPEEQIVKASELAALGSGSGCHTVKVKVGGNPEHDAARVAELLRILGAEVCFRLDANQQWSLNAALVFAEKIEALRTDAGLQLDYIEEPVLSVEDFRRFREATGLPTALDEKLLQAKSMQGLPEAEAWVVKPTLLGSIDLSPAPRVVISACFESGVGISHLAKMALQSGEVAGLDTYGWLAEDVLSPRLELSARELRMPEPVGVLVQDAGLEVIHL